MAAQHDPPGSSARVQRDAQPDVEHLKLIQGVITRLAGNSFLLKGWAVTLVAGLSALAKTGGDRGIGWIACGVVVVFALLDATYLAYERAFRNLYTTAVKCPGTVPPWSLTITKPGAAEILLALTTWSVWPLYTAAAFGAVLVGVGV